MTLFHITTAEEAAAGRASGEYRPAAFAREGFVHCSYPHQVRATANRIFHGRSGLVLLQIDEAGVGCPVIVENLEGGAERYPHIYGPVPAAAIIAVHPYPCDAAGAFGDPPSVA